MRKKYRTVSIPEELMEQVEMLIAETGFRTPTEFVLYHLRKDVAKIQNRKRGKVKLRQLGYLE